MNSADLLVEKNDSLLRLILNRPDRLNAMTLDMKKGVLRALAEAATDETVRAVVFTGAGRGFCAGVDLDELKESSVGWLVDDQNIIKEIILTLTNYPKPVIAAVNGVAVGIGFSLVLACDIIIAAASARFAGLWVKRGLHPDGGSTLLLPRRVGTGKAQELLLTGRMVPAEEAVRIGLANQMVPDADLAQATADMVALLAQGAPLAQAWIRASIYQGATMELGTMLDYETRAQAVLNFTEDCKEAVTAFVEKRPPVYRWR